jgi:hypothetical protein
MFRCRSQNLPNIAALCVCWPDAIRPIGECDISISTDIDDNLSLSGKTVNMPLLMVLRISNEQYIAETKRRHTKEYNPRRLGYQTLLFMEIPGRNLNLPAHSKSPLTSC